MEIPEDQIRELATLYPEASRASESGSTYFLIPALSLPSTCSPEKVDALLCPAPRDGYNSRLFFSSMVCCKAQLNWNAQSIRILDRNWFAYSWKTPGGQRLAQMLAAHVGALR